MTACEYNLKMLCLSYERTKGSCPPALVTGHPGTAGHLPGPYILVGRKPTLCLSCEIPIPARAALKDRKVSESDDMTGRSLHATGHTGPAAGNITLPCAVLSLAANSSGGRSGQRATQRCRLKKGTMGVKELKK